MEKYALELNGVTKQYKDFKLDSISFTVPQGSIVGLIGENGAGKSTTINAILGLIVTEQGKISVFNGKDVNAGTKEHIGVVFDGSNYPDNLTPKKLGKVFQNIYAEWNNKKYFELLNKFELPINKKLKEFSKGMNMKYSIAVALSHNSKLLILDEATSGLDPIIRDDILEMFLDFIQDEEHSILVSSHITSDLEKIADYIAFIHEGKLILSTSKDELIYEYGLMKCRNDEFDMIDKEDIIRYRIKTYEVEILVKDREKMAKKYPNCIVDPTKLDDIMMLYVKGEQI